MSKDLIGYEEIIQDAMRGVVREALRRVSDTGLPSGHQLYLTFQTDRADVSLPDAVRAANPAEITIVLQNQFWDLKVEGQDFRVTLNFNKLPWEIVVPFDALLGFADSGANFGLQFRKPGENSAAGEGPEAEASADDAGAIVKLESAETTPDAKPKTRDSGTDKDVAAVEKKTDNDAQSGANVVQIDRFRRK